MLHESFLFSFNTIASWHASVLATSIHLKRDPALRRIATGGGTFFDHLAEQASGTRHISCGGMEAVYDDMPRRLGFGQFAPLQPAHGPMFSVRNRAKLAGEPVPPVIQEAEFYRADNEQQRFGFGKARSGEPFSWTGFQTRHLVNTACAGCARAGFEDPTPNCGIHAPQYSTEAQNSCFVRLPWIPARQFGTITGNRGSKSRLHFWTGHPRQVPLATRASRDLASSSTASKKVTRFARFVPSVHPLCTPLRDQTAIPLLVANRPRSRDCDIAAPQNEGRMTLYGLFTGLKAAMVARNDLRLRRLSKAVC